MKKNWNYKIVLKILKPNLLKILRKYKKFNIQILNHLLIEFQGQLLQHMKNIAAGENYFSQEIIHKIILLLINILFLQRHAKLWGQNQIYQISKVFLKELILIPFLSLYSHRKKKTIIKHKWMILAHGTKL